MSKLRIAVAMIVTSVWAVVYVIDVFNKDFEAPPEVSGVMLAVVAWLFGREIRDKILATEKEKS